MFSRRGAHHGPELPSHRRRQPLLRDGGRAPATRQEFRFAVQAVQQGSHTPCCGGKLFRFIPNLTFDPIIVAAVWT